MSEVHILSSHGVFAVVANLLNSPTRECRRFSSADVDLPPDAVVIIHANSKVEDFAPDIYDANGAAAWLRRHHRSNPIVWVAGEVTRIVANEGDPIANTFAAVGSNTENSVNLPWFAPLYDVALRIPSQITQLRDAVEVAQRRIGTRKPLVEAAIKRALQTQLEDQGVHEDHLWKNLQAVLRFLRGAQCEWMIHPDDAKDVITEIKNQVDLHPEDFEWAKDAQQLLDSQTKRWEDYKSAFETLSSPTPIKTFEELTSAGLPYRLLLIDDQWERMGWKILLQRLLAPYGFEVEADDGKSDAALIKKLKTKKYNVVLLDLNLEASPTPLIGEVDEKGGRYAHMTEDLTGLDRLKTICQYSPHTPVIYFTGYERISLERDRQQVGVLGYIVKQEQIEGKQDAQGYYNRLIELCQQAIEHEMRAILLLQARHLEVLAPALFEKVGTRLCAAISEISDPLVTCVQSGLILESAVVHSYWRNTSDRGFGENIKNFRNSVPTPAKSWVSAAKLLRNSMAHPEIGTFQVKPLDALFAAGLDIHLLYKCERSGINPPEEKVLCRLLCLSLRFCADRLEELATLWRDAPSVLCLHQASLVIRQMRQTARELEDNAVDSSEKALRQLRDFLNTTLAAMSKHLLGSPENKPISSTKYIHGLFVYGTDGNYVSQSGYEDLVLVPHIYLHGDVLPILTKKYSVDHKDILHQFLLTVAFTRIIAWCWNEVLPQSCPTTKDLLQIEMTVTDIKTRRTGVSEDLCLSIIDREIDTLRLTGKMGLDIAKFPAFRIFLAGTILAQRLRQCNGVVSKLGEEALAEMAGKQLLMPIISEPEKREAKDKLLTDKKQKEEEHLNAIQKQLKHAERASLEAREKKEKEQERGKLFEEQIQGNVDWQLLAQLDKSIKGITANIPILQGEIDNAEEKELQLLEAQEETEKRLESMCIESQRIAGQLPRLKEMSAKYKNLKSGLDDAPTLVLQIVRECAPDLEAELKLLLTCLRLWTWSEQRYDLPLMLAEISQQWERMGQSRV